MTKKSAKIGIISSRARVCEQQKSSLRSLSECIAWNLHVEHMHENAQAVVGL